MEKKEISRRKFLAGAAAISSASVIASCTGQAKSPLSASVTPLNSDEPVSKPQAGAMPKRILGKTGLSVSILAFGCGSKFAALSNPTGRYAALDAALAGGINYFDCASEYGTASTLGNYWSSSSVPVSRDKVIIVTKLNARDYNGAKTEFENQLTQLKMSYVDILLLHALPSDLDLSAISSSTGAWKFLQDAKAAGTAKYIGFSSMDNTAAAGVLRDFCNQLEPDVATLAMNVTGYGNMKTVTLPAANAKNAGVAVIKSLLGVVSATRTAAQCLAYLWDLKDEKGNYRVATVIVGHDGGASQVDTNVAIAKAYNTGVLSYDAKKLEREAKALSGPHALAYARPDFKDNGKPYIWL